MSWYAQTMLRCPRRVPVGAEPREDDRDATADCPARRKSAVGAGEENREKGSRNFRKLHVAAEIVKDGAKRLGPLRPGLLDRVGNLKFSEVLVADLGEPAAQRRNARV